MPTSEIMHMINQGLQAMAVGIPGVFLVLAVFYFVLKVLMMRTMRRSKNDKDEK